MMLAFELSTNMSLKNESLPLSTREVAHFDLQRRQFLLGLQEGEEFNPCTLSLTPWRLKKKQFEQAMLVAKSLSLLFMKASQDYDFLQQSLADFNDPSSLLSHLKATLTNQSAYRATGINLSRQDLLLDNKGQWRLVENNAIAAGMGPFSERLGVMLDASTGYLSAESKSTNAPNPATESIAKSLYDAAYANRHAPAPLILFLVEADEKNIHDQNALLKLLQSFGANVIRQTFSELSTALESDGNYLRLEKQGIVDAIYFRTGYNLSHYRASEDDLKYLPMREWIERHQLAVAPSINQQIASSKWVQAKLSGLTAAQLSQQFCLKSDCAKLARNALNTRYIFPSDIQQINQSLDNREWILKSQNEGGGNVFDKTCLPSTIDFVHQQWLLMKEIQSHIRSEGLTILDKQNSRRIPQAISELGIFSLGEQHQYGGYLLRSKPFDQLETGVHQSGGFLDSVRLIS